MTSLETYRKQRTERNKRIIEKADETAKGTQQAREVDERFWKPTIGKDGNGYAVIRFLDSRHGEDFPFVRIWSHSFQGPGGKWYIENSLTTIGQSDPCGELNSQLWATGLEENQNQVRRQKRKTAYISNILVVKDPGHPENDGKVFLYRYGKTIFDKINTKMNPGNEFDESENPFDLETGRNLKIRIKTVRTGDRSYPNYDDSEWDAPSPVGKTPKEIEDTWSNCYDLKEFTDPSKFKGYDELKKRLNEVLTGGYTPSHLDTPKPSGPFASAEATDLTKEEDDISLSEEDILARLNELAN